MDKRVMPFAGSLVAVVALLAPQVRAASLVRADQMMAAGACQPFVPTNQVRYNASGLHNLGPSLIYVVCSMGGTVQHLDDNTQFLLGVSNNSSVEQTIFCTARPGIAGLKLNSQVASSQSKAVAAGSASSFVWDLGVFGGASVASNPNFTCAVGPGVSVEFIQVRYTENVGL